MTLKTLIRHTGLSMALGLLIVAQAFASDGASLLQEDFEGGISERWVEQGFPSIDRKNVFSLAIEAWPSATTSPPVSSRMAGT